MNVQAFREAREEANHLIKDHHLPNPYADEAHRKLGACRKVMNEAPKPEHDIVENAGFMMSDQAVCACGWKSHSFWDGWEYAVDEWYEHVAREVGLVPEKCPCGKEYVTADGGGPCHDLVERGTVS